MYPVFFEFSPAAKQAFFTEPKQFIDLLIPEIDKIAKTILLTVKQGMSSRLPD